MAGRGAQTFHKRQKEQLRKEKQQEKFAKRLEKKKLGPGSGEENPDDLVLERLGPFDDAGDDLAEGIAT